MIISLSGAKGSGKDLVGAIMLLLLDPPDEDIKQVTRDLLEYGHAVFKPSEPSWHIKKWATKLKEEMQELHPDHFNMDEWEANKGAYRECFVPALGMSRREALIRLGDKRRAEDDEYFIKPLASEYLKSKIPSNWIVTDSRFMNELHAVKVLGGLTIKVVREKEEIEGRLSIRKEWVATHASETEFEEFSHDYTIINDGTVDDLTASIKEILAKEGLLK